jgi:hypothetical protein
MTDPLKQSGEGLFTLNIMCLLFLSMFKNSIEIANVIVFIK